MTELGRQKKEEEEEEANVVVQEKDWEEDFKEGERRVAVGVRGMGRQEEEVNVVVQKY